jgi:hypothetical protein
MLPQFQYELTRHLSDKGENRNWTGLLKKARSYFYIPILLLLIIIIPLGCSLLLHLLVVHIVYFVILS